MKNLLLALVSQDRAVANARSATTRLLGRRVEREEVELFLEQLADRRGSHTAAVPAELVARAREVMPR